MSAPTLGPCGDRDPREREGAKPPAEASSACWPKRRRLLRRADFRAAYDHGMRSASRHFTVFGRAHEGAGGRVGITASRKLGPAVVRNRIRRRTRELLRRLPPSATAGCHLVVNPRPTVASADLAVLGQELEEQVRRLCVRLRIKS
ncbi:MAG: ribonuclease P protein component [Terriglobales bacterium]